ncbi:uncharacterized protein LOC112088032 [Eutrema salsugineum]|uniref:uncharacterized protein LOC112088032 n=1 Tax=Eutrema salsugineum TaxID=72664 RepID=UPI000CED2719|nr:uncharacterized protein LOC112088032 [Eutrema salsugineum]
MLEKSGCRYERGNFKVQFYKGKKKVISGKYQGGLYYLQGTVSKVDVNMPKAEVEVKKKKVKKVTFSENLIQGATPYGFETRDSSAQGGDSSSSEKSESYEVIESKESKEESEIESTLDDIFESKKRMHQKSVGEEESLNKELEVKNLGKVSKILGMGFFGDKS